MLWYWFQNPTEEQQLDLFLFLSEANLLKDHQRCPLNSFQVTFFYSVCITIIRKINELQISDETRADFSKMFHETINPSDANYYNESTSKCFWFISEINSKTCIICNFMIVVNNVFNMSTCHFNSKEKLKKITIFIPASNQIGFDTRLFL